jgi:Peptidase family M23
MKRFLALLPVLLAFQVGVSPALAWTWPVDGPVLQPFSFDPGDPYAAGQHRGIDIAASRGAPVVAPAGGTISFAGTVPGGGLTLAIRTPDGYSATLVHLGVITVARGATVGEGSIVGSVGPSGDPEHAQPYVHLGIRIAADPQGYVDPLSLLPAGIAPVEAGGEAATGAPADADADTGDKAPAEAPAPEPAASSDGDAAEGADAARVARSREAARKVDVALPAARLAERAEREPVPAIGRPAAGRKRDKGVPALSARAVSGEGVVEQAAPSEVSDDPTPARDARRWLTPALLAVAAMLAAAGLVARRQLRDAGVANGAAAVFSQRAAASAEHAGRLRLGEEDDVLVHGDLERVLLGQPEPFPDLDRDHDAAELVDVPDDPRRPAPRLRRRGPQGCSRSHHRRRTPLSARLLQ